MKNGILNVGVVGAGNMGRNHLRTLATMHEFNLVGCFDTNSEAAEQQAALYDIQAFSSPEKLFEAVDVVHLATPSFLHREGAVAAAEAGCHILVEKPIALTLVDAQAIIDVCRNANVRLCVGHVERYNPAIEALSSILANEELISIEFHRMSPYDGRILDANVVEDLMIHDIDILNSLASSKRLRLESQGVETYSGKLDYVQALISYEDGLLASLTASRVTESKIRQAWVNTKKAFIMVDYLNRTVKVSRKTSFTLDVGHRLEYKQENIIEQVFVPMIEPLRAEFQHFAHCIISGEPIKTSGEMGKAALELCLEITAAATDSK